jgi:toxin ParE1/3/4
MAEDRLPIFWSPEALNDLDRLWDYYARTGGRTLADNTLRAIARAVATIEDFPFAGRSRDGIGANLRSLAASPHIIFYRLMHDRPEIVRVLDGRQDIEEIFSDGEDS